MSPAKRSRIDRAKPRPALLGWCKGCGARPEGGPGRKGRGHAAVYREGRQEPGDLRAAQIPRVVVAVEQDEPAHPVHVAGLGADRIVAHADRLTQAFQQPGRRGSGGRRGRGEC